jgi:hypothetical protein
MEDVHDPKSCAAQSAEQNRISSSPEVSQSTLHRNILRSCLTCHQCKIRCDKRSPCSNCVRNDVLCCYPEVEQRRRRPQKQRLVRSRHVWHASNEQSLQSRGVPQRQMWMWFQILPFHAVREDTPQQLDLQQSCWCGTATQVATSTKRSCQEYWMKYVLL